MLKEYIRIKRIDLYVKSLFYKYKLVGMKETLLKMKNNLKELRWLNGTRKTYWNWSKNSKIRRNN